MPASRKRKVPYTAVRRVTRAAYVGVLAVFFTIALLVGMMVMTKLLTPISRDVHAKSVIVMVKRGWGPREIGEMLEQKYLIRKAAGFRLAIKLNHMSGKMQAGQYSLSPAMTPRQMAEIIALGRTISAAFTVPEGFTVDQIAARLERMGMGNKDKFLELARSKGRTFHLHGFTPPSDNLEGYLYPDTYFVQKGTSERDIILMMLNAFRAQALNNDNMALAKRGKGIPDVMKLASLVEREAKVDSDRPMIAAVYVNRLNKNMPLQCDATVQYALPEHKDRLYFRDLKVDSPYNTYIHRGLPPTPIASPGWPSIDAALKPATVSYLFYVARKDGTHAFARTFDEFKRVKAQLSATNQRT